MSKPIDWWTQGQQMMDFIEMSMKIVYPTRPCHKCCISFLFDNQRKELLLQCTDTNRLFASYDSLLHSLCWHNETIWSTIWLPSNLNSQTISLDYLCTYVTRFNLCYPNSILYINIATDRESIGERDGNHLFRALYCFKELLPQRAQFRAQLLFVILDEFEDADSYEYCSQHYELIHQIFQNVQAQTWWSLHRNRTLAETALSIKFHFFKQYVCQVDRVLGIRHINLIEFFEVYAEQEMKNILQGNEDYRKEAYTCIRSILLDVFIPVELSRIITEYVSELILLKR